jgi:16S rRNA (guanine527-N7)-methyltransferase
MSDREATLRALDVSRETIERLDKLASLLERWNPRINLVSRASIGSLWNRHILDSAQLLDLAPKTGRWVDLGSGGGFPGLVIALMSDRRMILVDADQRKCSFLRTVLRETRAEADVVCGRIEDIEPLHADVLSARALAPLTTLLEYAERHLMPHGVALFPKGRTCEREIEDALAKRRFDCEKVPSTTDPEAVVLRIGGITRV